MATVRPRLIVPGVNRAVRATFVNPGYFVTPGQFGRIRIPASQQHVAILVPDGAVVTDQSRKVGMTNTPLAQFSSGTLLGVANYVASRHPGNAEVAVAKQLDAFIAGLAGRG